MVKKKSSARSKTPRIRNQKSLDAKRELPTEIKNEARLMVQNGLASALGLNEASLLGFNPGSIGTQLTQVDTLFINQRWYLVSNMRQLLSQAYVEIGLIQTIVDVPVDDALRGGIEIKSKQLSEEQVQKLQISVDRDDDLNTVGQACKWNRLYGGAGVLVMTDQDPEEPLDIEAITEDSPLEFRAVDMWELFWDKQNTEGYDPERQAQNFEHYNYYAKKLHKSRVMRMKGMISPSFIRPRLRGWGFSVVESLITSINQFLKSKNVIFEVMDEFKLDIFKIKGLVDSLLTPDGESQIRTRISLANTQKNYQNAMAMDVEDDYVQKQLSFAGLAEMGKEFRMQIASDMRMPMSKLFGIAATGFSSGEDDIEVYNSMVESQVRNKIKYDILRILEIKCQALFGFVPEDLSINFKPLRVLSAEQEENVKTQKFNRALQARQAGEISSLQFLDIMNRENLLGIQLETDMAKLNPNDPEVAEEVREEGSKPDADVDDPGANRFDTRRPTLRTEPPLKSPVQNEYNDEEIHETITDELMGLWDGVDRERKNALAKKYENPGKVDEGLWSKAKRAAGHAGADNKYAFATWWYLHHGGTFG